MAAKLQRKGSVADILSKEIKTKLVSVFVAVFVAVFGKFVDLVIVLMVLKNRCGITLNNQCGITCSIRCQTEGGR